jgi:hypothetical protein
MCANVGIAPANVDDLIMNVLKTFSAALIHVVLRSAKRT